MFVFKFEGVTKRTIKRVLNDIDRMSELGPRDLETFFNWFLATQKLYDFYNTNRYIPVRKHKKVSKISYMLSDESESIIRFRITDIDNFNRVDKIIIHIYEDYLSIHIMSTCSNFEREYKFIKVDKDKLDDKDSYRSIFYTIKDIIKYTCSQKLKYELERGGSLDQAIPLRLFRRF